MSSATQTVPPPEEQLWIIVTQQDASAILPPLKEKKLLDRSHQIQRDTPTIRTDFGKIVLPDPLVAIPTLIYKSNPQMIDPIRQTDLVYHMIRLESTVSAMASRQGKPTGNKLEGAVRTWLEELPTHIKEKLPSPPAEMARVNGPWPFEIYGNLARLPPALLHRQPWKGLIESLPPAHVTGEDGLYERVRKSLGVTHLGCNAPIPLTSADFQENILRTPSGFTPLLGDFGKLEPYSIPAIDRAYWATAKQNDIYQIFAPLYTMFSRGNISEKQRILKHAEEEIKGAEEAVAEARAQELERGTNEMRLENLSRKREFAAVDLFAGIGYFAFSYAKAGFEFVLAWELNPWSVEGFARGAEKNGWGSRIINEGELYESIDGYLEQMVIFGEDNCNALARVQSMRKLLSPITRVNCGYLPSSQGVWLDAVKILDPKWGGYIHAHENVAVRDIGTRMEEIEVLFAQYVFQDDAKVAAVQGWSVKCTHVERVKSFAPGVMHCVFDIIIKPNELFDAIFPD